MEQCIVYLSKAREPFDQHLLAILERSRRVNPQYGITGVMLYVRGSIVQVLEGEQQAVEQLYRNIEVDPRHYDVERIMTRPITQRQFAERNMGYETISTSQLEEIHGMVRLNTDPDDASVDEPLVLRVLRTFYQSNRYNPVP